MYKLLNSAKPCVFQTLLLVNNRCGLQNSPLHVLHPVNHCTLSYWENGDVYKRQLQKSGIYKLKCKDCNKVYLGETGRKFVCKLSDHKRGEGNRTTNSLYTRHFIEDNHTFVNPLEEYEFVKVVNNT